MSVENLVHPEIAGPEAWLAARKALLTLEKEVTRFRDKVSAQRRRLPMIKVEKEYSFETESGKLSLLDLFKGRQQLIVYHFMFDPEWEKGCGGCTSFVNALGDLSMLGERNTTFVLISRAPLEKLLDYKKIKGWDENWVSSFGSDFNYDFHATMDQTVVPVEYNYMTMAEIEAKGLTYITAGEQHGLSVFFRVGEEVFHTYSTYARGTESLTDTYDLLDVTPLGRQEDWEDSPAGWPQNPTYG